MSVQKLTAALETAYKVLTRLELEDEMTANEYRNVSKLLSDINTEFEQKKPGYHTLITRCVLALHHTLSRLKDPRLKYKHPHDTIVQDGIWYGTIRVDYSRSEDFLDVEGMDRVCTQITNLMNKTLSIKKVSVQWDNNDDETWIEVDVNLRDLK